MHHMPPSVLHGRRGLFKEHDVPSSPLLNLQDFFEEPQLRYLRILVEMGPSRMRKVSLVGGGVA